MMDHPGTSEFTTAFERTLRLSKFCARLAASSPEWAADLRLNAGEPFSRLQMLEALSEDDPDDARPAGAAGRALRRLRARVMLRLAHRDLNGLAPLGEVLETMTALAEVTIAHGARRAHRAACALHGEPRGEDGEAQALIVVALGKLGGGELNVSSDVDLVFAYGEDGPTEGARSVSNHEFFALAGRKLIALLSEATADGQVFRVDMRLRPYGDSGPLVASLASLEAYFIGQARPWERYAWLKARVLSGPSAGLEALVRPFVYRRYLDFGLVAALRDLHARILEAAVQKRKFDDIKVGAGGIREVEFVAQLHQLIRGGQDPALQTTSTRTALAALASRGLLEPARVQLLAEAYAFLRRLEHRLQYYDDQQTQAMPVESAHRATIAEAMGFADPQALATALAVHRQGVQESFNTLFERQAPAPPAVRLAGALADPQSPPDPEAIAAELAGAGISGAEPVAEQLIAFARSRRYRALSAGCRSKVDALLPLLIEAASAEGGQAATALRLLRLIEAIDRREAYLSLLVEFPAVLRRAARLAARSAWAASLLERHPILLDELTRSAASFTATDWAAERRELQAACAGARDDTERALDLLRHYKQRQVLRLTLADLEGELPVMALSDELSALADTILEVVLREAAASQALDCESAGLAVIGYGKLGGKELGYGSDLDVVFLYDETRGAEPERLARVAQRVNSWLTSHTSAGVLYETDLRLRPDGASGLLVSSLSAFRDYQEHRAWAWEHQALTRARYCAGDAATGAQFEKLRAEILARPREAAPVLEAIAGMRRKMGEETRGRGAERDLKLVPGGLIDLEFCVQALVLVHAGRHARLLENRGNHTLLRWAGELGLLGAEVANAAADAYLALRKRTHEAALNDEPRALVAAGELDAERAAVRTLWTAVFGDGEKATGGPGG